MTQRLRSPRTVLLCAVLGLSLAATACSGGGAAAEEGVATLQSSADAGGTATDAGAADDEEVTEEALLEWVECMRGEGFDIADPTVDADGNLTLGAPGGGGGGGAGGGAGGLDRESRQASTEICGDPPLARGGFGFSEEDQTARQDQALAFAECMRDLGHDVADPTVTDGPGGAGGQLGALDLEDPIVQADLETCQTEAFGEDGAAFGRGAGGGARGGRGQ